MNPTDNKVVAIYLYNVEDMTWNSAEFSDIKKGNKFKMIRENGEFVINSKGEDELVALSGIVLDDNSQPMIMINKGE